MAAIEPQAATPPAKGRRRSRQRSTHVEVTPLVDLAFLLLTFFLLTTTFAKPCVMQLAMPVADYAHPTYVDQADALTIILGKNHRVHYYFGLNQPRDKAMPGAVLKTTNLGDQGIRQVLLDRQRRDPVVVLIKPGPAAHYQDMVDILDAMSSTHQRKYALTKLTPDDLTLLQTTAAL